MMRHLIVFDFDHTIIEENSDLYVCKLAPNGKLPKHIKDLYSPDGWTKFMQQIFNYLYANGARENDYTRVLKECSFIEGFAELMTYLVQSNVYDIVIISDANSVFIDSILHNLGIREYIESIYTNPASFDDKGCLQLKPYHKQDWCRLSTENLCKGEVLEKHVNKKLKEGIEYESDGTNDLCPSLRLDRQGHCFARRGLKLAEQAKAASDRYKGDRQSKLWPDKVDDAVMQAKVHIWKTGQDIIDTIKSLILS